MTNTLNQIDRKIRTLERRYAKVGVDVTQVVLDVDNNPIATQFLCNECGCMFSPTVQIRKRYRCPNGCNGNKVLGRMMKGGDL